MDKGNGLSGFHVRIMTFATECFLEYVVSSTVNHSFLTFNEDIILFSIRLRTTGKYRNIVVWLGNIHVDL